MTPPEILDLEERGEIIHIDSLSFTWEKNDNTEATSYDWAWAIQPDGQRQKRVSEFLTECLAGGKIPVFINPDLFVGGEVVPRSGVPEACCAFVEF